VVELLRSVAATLFEVVALRLDPAPGLLEAVLLALPTMLLMLGVVTPGNNLGTLFTMIWYT
jgi:hypothetical protein